ncbi:lysozyme-like protein [Trametes cingulata]|nr:lysozyme-like protein [Trametes cingulata]
MKLSAPFVLILAALGVAEATSHDVHARMAKHHAVARSGTVVRRGTNGRCKVRPTSTLVSSTHSTSHTQAAQTTHAAPAALNNKDASKGSNNNNNKSGNSGSGDSNKSIGSAKSLIAINDSSCGWPGATKEITPTHGPNGSLDWLNCGVEDGGWNPPYVQVSDIVAVDLAEAVKDPHSPFKACSKYIDTFTRYANEHGIPPILIASIAMQESSCNPETVGGAGEQGLMQITKDKCGGAPGNNCRDPDFNIRTGTAYFAQTLKDNGGSLLLTIGGYNGWPKGMTIGSATEAAHKGCCPCQNNIDYLMQMLNGWVLNKDPYTSSPRIGKYFNLEKCY